MKLTPESRAQAYKRLTNEIRSFVNHSVGAAKAILEAKRLEIWKEKWSSWREYCEQEFGKSRRRIYQLLDVASAIDDIESVQQLHNSTPENQAILENLSTRQAKELKGLPKIVMAEVFHRAVAVEGGKSPKPETIAKVRQSVNGAPVPRGTVRPRVSAKSLPVERNGHVTDERGTVIPKDILALWLQRDKCDQIAQQLSDLKCFFEQAHNEGHPLFRQMNCQDAYLKLQAIRFCVLESKPYAVCRNCGGHPTLGKAGCELCCSTGLIGKNRWRTLPEETRNIRIQA